MRTFIIAAVTAMTLASTVGATDIQNQDAIAHTVTIDGVAQVEIAADSEVTGVCDGCTIALPDGASVEANAEGVVVIADGQISIAE